MQDQKAKSNNPNQIEQIKKEQNEKIEEFEKALNTAYVFVTGLKSFDYAPDKAFSLIDQITENLEELKKVIGGRIFSIRFNNHCYEKSINLEKHESHKIENIELIVQEFLNFLDSKKQFAYLKKIESLYGTNLAERLLKQALKIKSEDKEEIIKEIKELLNYIKEIKNPYEDKIVKQTIGYLKLERETQELREKDEELQKGRSKGGRIKGANYQDSADLFLIKTDYLRGIKTYSELEEVLKRKHLTKTELHTRYNEFREKNNEKPVSYQAGINHIKKALEKRNKEQ